jgi:phenylpyruvate tautomerase PptA (4-oxalocrotonate tautomerase family)
LNIHELLERYDLKPQHAYLLELIPLIEVMWVDGRNQRKEADIIHQITEKHVSELNRLVEGITVISNQDAQDFLNRFLHTRPSEGLLTELRELTVVWLEDKAKIDDKGDTIMGYCLDIAAACASTNKFDDRIVEQEKQLLKELAEALEILG